MPLGKDKCCNCGGMSPVGYYGDPKPDPQNKLGTWFKCDCLCHSHGGKYPTKKQKTYEKKHPEQNEKAINFPSYFKKLKEEKQKIKAESVSKQ